MRRLRDESGFQLIELLVAMTLSVVVLFAVLGAFDTFQSNTDSSSRRIDAQDSGRRDINRVVQMLREAGVPAPVTGAGQSAVISAGGLDYQFRTTSWPGESGTGAGGVHTARLCVNTTTKVLWFNGLKSGTSGAATPGSACPSTATGWTAERVATGILNTATNPLFVPSSSGRSVAVNLRLESDRESRTRTLRFDSGGTLRGALAPATTGSPGQPTVSCEGGKALLSVNAAGVKLSATNGIQAGDGKLLVTVGSGVTTNIALTLTNVQGLQSLLTVPVTC